MRVCHLTRGVPWAPSAADRWGGACQKVAVGQWGKSPMCCAAGQSVTTVTAAKRLLSQETLQPSVGAWPCGHSASSWDARTSWSVGFSSDFQNNDT